MQRCRHVRTGVLATLVASRRRYAHFPHLINTALAVFCISFMASSLAADPPTQVTFGGDAAYPPFERLEQGSPTGFNVDLAQAIVDMSATRLEYQLGDWPTTIAGLESGAIDVVPMFASAERNERFLFTSPFYYVTHSIYAHRNATPLYFVEDLAGVRVALEERSYAHSQLDTEGIQLQAVLAPNTVAALQALADGRADYAILATPTADNLLQTMQDPPMRKLGPSFWPAGYVFAVRKDRSDLLAWLQDALNLAIGTGHYQQVYDKWKNELEASPNDNNERERLIASYLALALFMLSALVLAWSWSLRRRVRSRTQELQGALDRTQAAEARARHLSNYNEDTGLAKPHRFTELVNQMLAKVDQKSPGSKEMLVVKLVQLNEVVRVLGKAYSEELIREFASSIVLHARGPCSYFGRGVFAVCADRDNVRALFSSLLEHWNTQNQGVYSHIVGGSAYYPEDGQDGDTLIQRAETALAVSRSSRRRWTAYDPAMEPNADDLEIVSLFRGKQLDSLYAVYQVQVDLKTGAIAGAEALVRWKHPRLGIVPPSRFIPLIEKAGLIAQVTAKMINEAVRLSAQLRRDGLPSLISVNITVSDLTETDLPQLVGKTLAAYGGNPRDLKLELTETSVTSDFKYVTDVLHRLHEMDICISVDDFGTGYSSLHYLSFFPIHEVKIDRDFVCDMAVNAKNRSIVRSTILMANELELNTVAEGAEDTATLELLREYGCAQVQGFVFSKPLPEAGFLDFVRQHGGKSLLRDRAIQAMPGKME